jgi:prophage maintenance system killer protein
MKNRIVIYQGKNGEIKFDADFKAETIWATQAQIAELFNVNVPAVSKHLKNIYADGELRQSATVSKMEIVQIEGGREVKRLVDYYSLDAIISVGYRINSKNATQFRIWATNVLKTYLSQGYTINKQRLMQLGKMIEVFERANIPEVSGVAEIVGGYLGGLNLLEQYDEEKLTAPKGRKGKWELTYAQARKFVDALPFAGENSLFGNERGGSFKGILAGLYQSFGGEELYPSVENKAANLLYQIVKDHPFSDGNKRSAAALFVYFLDRNKVLCDKSGRVKIAPNALAAITLMIALSRPAEKETMIMLVMNLIDLEGAR